MDDEALDSWLEALAARMSASWGEVVASVGLAPADEGLRRDYVAHWLRGLSVPQLSAASRATGVSAERIAAMTFAVLHARLTDSSGLPPSSTESMLFLREGRSRFCPSCLSENSGRWLLWWRLRWAFACPLHACLLADSCPSCFRYQRGGAVPAALVPVPRRCTRKGTGAHGRDITRCDGDLSEAAVLALPGNHVAIDAQRAVLDALSAGTADFGSYRGRRVSFAEFTADVAALGGRMLAYARDDDLYAVLPSDLVDQYMPDRGDRHTRVTATAPASTAAVGVTAAWSVLSASTVGEAATRLGWLIDLSRARGSAVRPSTIGWGRGISGVLSEVQHSALHRLHTPLQQLRHTDYPAANVDRSARLAAGLPTLVWPCWSSPLRGRGLGQRELRSALPVLIASVGVRTPLDEVIEALGSATTPRRVSRVAHLLQSSMQWEAIRSAIATWADYIDRRPPPIDYRRRRAVPCRDLLPPEVWQEIALSSGVEPGKGVRLALVRCWVFERLTTLPAASSPWAIDSAEFRTKLGAISLWLTAEMVSALDAYAAELLASQAAIVDEPVVWCPCAVGAPSGPEADTAGVDIAAMHQWIGVHRPVSFTGLTKRFDLDIDTIRHALEQRPTPAAVMSVGASHETPAQRR